MINIVSIISSKKHTWKYFLSLTDEIKNRSIQDDQRTSSQKMYLSRLERDFLGLFSDLLLIEENHFLALFKPPGFLSQKDRTKDPSIVEFAKEYLRIKYKKSGNVFLHPVHRLDRVTSGIMILARTTKGLSRLAESFRQRRIDKKYWAVIDKKPMQKKGKIEGFFIKKKTDYAYKSEIIQEMALSDSPSGTEKNIKEYNLSYIVKAQKNNFYILEVAITGGKFHQIRALLSSNSMPILGDVKYGGRPVLKKFSYMAALVACSLVFPHPVKNETVCVEFAPVNIKMLLDFFAGLYGGKG